MFGRMKLGDLVIVPGRIFEPVNFAEVVSDFDPKDVVSIERYGNEEIPVRRVRWINAAPRLLIPSDLQVYLSKPPAIAHVARSFQTEEFFRLAYPAYILADKSAVIMDGPKYDGKNPLATHEANYLVSYFIAAFAAIEQDKLVAFAKLDVKAAVAAFYDPALVQSFTQNFNSPGRYGLTLRSAVLGTFVSTGVALSLYACNPASLRGGVDVTNSISPQDQAVQDAGIKLDYLFKALHKKEIDEINGLAKRAKENIGLTTPVQVEVEVIETKSP